MPILNQKLDIALREGNRIVIRGCTQASQMVQSFAEIMDVDPELFE